MDASQLNPLEWINDGGRKAHVLLITKTLECSQDPTQRQLMRLSAGATMLALCASTARAEGIADMAQTAGEQGEAVKTVMGGLFAVFGFILAGWGGYNWWRKGKEGENSRINAGQIAWPILGGAALGATGFLLVKAGETIGISGSSQGQLPD